MGLPKSLSPFSARFSNSHKLNFVWVFQRVVLIGIKNPLTCANQSYRDFFIHRLFFLLYVRLSLMNADPGAKSNRCFNTYSPAMDKPLYTTNFLVAARWRADASEFPRQGAIHPHTLRSSFPSNSPLIIKIAGEPEFVAPRKTREKSGPFGSRKSSRDHCSCSCRETQDARGKE